MALISSKGIYGLSAMYELSLKKSSKPTQIKDISKNAKIPQNYLEQLLVILRRADLVVSVRGAHGGYFLARKPEEISIKEILVALEGDLSVTEFDIENPVLKLFYEESSIKLKKIFDLSLKELQEYEDKLTNQISYII
ncbi:RrF2 family transcriptional regulator [Sulfurospirillum sp. 1307]|jgi:Rrf2 family protein